VAGGLWNAYVDSHQLENVVLNLAINARDAMPDGGMLTLELANAMLDDRYVRSFPDVRAGQYVMLSVTDTGTGMSPEVAEHAFDPFFTTKSEGEGTGLGLSMAYGFVKQSGGHIRIYSEVGHGTTVRAYLPRSSAEALDPIARQNAPMVGGSETVLVVEDDLKVQETVVEMLAELGYSVLKANNAEQALAVLNSGVHVDLLFTDVVMPGRLKSPEMARRAMLLQPHLRVLYTSGYTQNAIVHGGRLDPGVELLSKPYSREDLAFKIRQVLGISKAADAMSTPRPAETASSGLGMNVLVVEDDGPSLDAISELLSMLGHHPTGVGNASAAIEAMNAASFDVLLTDLNLPDMSGVDLARIVIARNPTVRVVLASGEILLPEDAADFSWRALRKPYTLLELEEALRESARSQ
ncbi:MAG TPA: response regulator, partial [Paraburkholderia sp.]|uniref:response regulator n=1 Tax=Paraburkholderia sp. TaxID=1926495 RepID=UPI002B4A4BF6